MHTQELGDYIGGESCVDLKPDVAENYHSRSGAMNRPRRRYTVAQEKEHPPPIRSRWFVKRYSTSDGRLVMKMETVKRREYFQAHRSNGRLLLNLFPLDEKLNMTEEINGGDDERLDINRTVEQELSDRGEYYRYNEAGVNPCGFRVPVAVAVAALRPPVQT